MLKQVASYFSLVKFSHTIFAMPFAFIGFFLGIKNNVHQYTVAQLGTLFILVIACMVFARSAAMAFNRYLDRYYDALNPRTATREIPKGIIRPSHALSFTVVMALLFVLTALLINSLCFILSPVALAVILGYSYTKRFTPLCHLILGLGLSLAPIGAYLAVTGQFSLVPVLFSLSVICWVSGFDIIYALQDVDFDRSQQLYSIPSWVGKSKALLVSRILHVCSFFLIATAGWSGGFGIIYWVGAILYGSLLVYQQVLVRPHDLSRVNLAFMTANGLASVIFSFFVIVDLFT
ncbi:MAG: 4-hydroxybenzoate octaprenyltransferase [Chitinophagia bacterium]|jgi:4-hydroxybenzoate polyprenyltransferase|nr:4-hydroxybenzoate octaprenyltransferase [Chitinophagia bacterium]